MINIDGSQGEGGGQVLRTSLSLALVTGEPFRIEKIRAQRPKPGLLRQHLTAVKAAAAVGGAEVEGAEIGSTQLTFHPRAIVPGDYTFAIGTAGSTTLVLQTILLPLLTAKSKSTVALEGGTHNPMAPTFDFLELAYAPLLRRMGANLSVHLERPGFYPAGGGRLVLSIEPTPALTPLALTTRGEARGGEARALIANLPRHIAERELAVVQHRLGWTPEQGIVTEFQDQRGPGNVITVAVASENVTDVFTGFGERQLRAEVVAGKVVDEVRRYLAAQDIPIGRYLADQLLLPMALAGEGAFRTLALTRHSTTNIDVIRQFLNVEIAVTRAARDDVLVEVKRPCS